ncbi:hypothetical protein F2P56_013268 [Juglans regia]|uniref:Uncharacterized protein At3g17950-like n=2 Tax=Juglans regia TaxID=51240 RepID=A0A2I4F2E6_JUGRE|nr:uncharacterized protein At3g17950-like [Juglans regia]KAF5469175.1 hypothetical protein F2P56_013268 [Juglans regia]
MLDPANNMLPPPSSPSISSVSSSDLDTESTGSFFHDRSTTLGTLMGVSFPAITFRAPSQHRDPQTSVSVSVSAVSRRAKKPRKNKNNAQPPQAMVERRRRWWQLCRDNEAKPGSLGEFLEVERRFGDGAFFGAAAAELEGVVVLQQQQQQHRQRNGNGRLLFADGRVLPPATDSDDGAATAGALCRFPVSLSGICSGGAG